MDILNSEFILFLSCAAKNSLKYMLIGGYAVNFHGYNRNTNDMDVWLEPTNDNRNNFINTLLCMHYSEQEVAPLYKEDFSQPFKATIGAPDASIDFLTFVHHTLDFNIAYKEKEIFEVEKETVIHFVSYNILKDMKLKAHRDKDYYDVARLEELRKK